LTKRIDADDTTVPVLPVVPEIAPMLTDGGGIGGIAVGMTDGASNCAGFRAFLGFSFVVDPFPTWSTGLG
jgi:hypothetical protein